MTPHPLTRERERESEWGIGIGIESSLINCPLMLRAKLGIGIR
jgi:hypothetical protein